MAPFAPFTIDEISKVFEEEVDAALENERREDVGAARAVEVAQEVREQGVLVPAHKGRCVGGCQGERRGVGNAVRARIRWHEVAGPCGNDVSYAASGVDDVVFVARDQMNVKVRHRLSCRFSDVDPDVEAVGLVGGRDGLASDGKGGEKLGLLVSRSVEPCHDVSLGDNEGVAVTDGEGVPESEHALAPVEDALGVRSTEGAGALGHRLRRVIVRVPSSPASTQARQRQRRIDRRATWVRWHTGHRWM